MADNDMVRNAKRQLKQLRAGGQDRSSRAHIRELEAFIARSNRPGVVTAQGGGNQGGGNQGGGDPGEFVARGGGSFGEGTAFDSLNFVKSLRGQLDRGEISVDEFLQRGQPVAKEGFRAIGGVAGRGSNAANIVNPLIGQFADLGFRHTGGTISDPTVVSNLPAGFQADVRESTLPSNLLGRDRAISDIPFDIQSDTDRFALERQAIRQEELARRGLGEIGDIQEARLGSLSDLLSERRNEAFRRDIPGILESSQTAGLLRSTGTGQALSQRAGELERDTSSLLGQQSLADRDVQISGLGSILDRNLSLQDQGLKRQFSLADFERQAQLARELGATSAPGVPQGGGKGGFASGATAGALAGAPLGAPGTIGGAIIGGTIGTIAGKKGK